MTTYNVSVTFTMGVTDDATNTDTEALPRFITLTEVREPLDIKVTDVRGGF